MKKRLFVGGLPYSVTQDQLQDLFSKAGTIVSCNIITDKYTGKSKGFGFVEFEEEAMAKKAIEMFDGYEWEGRKIAVNEARPREDRS